MFRHLHYFLFFTFSSIFTLYSLSEADVSDFSMCSPVEYTCGGHSYYISYPFRLPQSNEHCGYPGFNLTCNGDNTMLVTNIGGKDFEVIDIDYTTKQLHIIDLNFTAAEAGSCPLNFTNVTFESQLINYSSSDANLTVYLNCSSDLGTTYTKDLVAITCLPSDPGRLSYFSLNLFPVPMDVWHMCDSVVYVPIYEPEESTMMKGMIGLLGALKKGFELQWKVGEGWCDECERTHGVCGYNSSATNGEACFCSNSASIDETCRENFVPPTKHKSGKSKTKYIIIGASVAAAFLLACSFFFLWFRWRKRQQQRDVSNLLSGSFSSRTSFKRDAELGESNYHTHIFSYEELEAATDGFNTSKELGDGGFGTVYKGKLRDGRTVAVKRLYEHNYRRLEQFMNEVEILSRLRHQNLVTLYGCTSRHSRELLLVYEYIPNGTVADHLHGPLASKGALPWSTRMSIAIETADALAYLHNVEPQIIHRDVKSNNILLDNYFHVKVADFGLSRLFPLDATHVSTAPQGTPGYVDPEYHQCYQLTDKSDVYSFGVVLVELISSMPAVDINRHRHEINLANLAVTKIQNSQLEQLVDLELGYMVDVEIKRMINQVAELAFRCLQLDREMRPCIKEVLEGLKGIEGKEVVEVNEVKKTNEARLVKSELPPCSPDTVTERWESKSTTPNAST